MIYDLPAAVEVGGVLRPIRSDYRAALDILTALADPELTQEDKALVALGVFYEDVGQLAPGDYEEAIQRCFWFLDGGDDHRDDSPQPKLMDWEQDFRYIVAPINRVLGREVRAVEYLHWWSFLAAYCEIGDCTFAQVVRIRALKARGKTLDKSDREWYQQNRQLVDLKTNYTQQEKNVLQYWGGKGR